MKEHFQITKLLEKDTSYRLCGLWDYIANLKTKTRQREAYEKGAKIYYHQGVTDTLRSMRPDLESCTVLSDEERMELYGILNKLKITFFYIEPQGFIPEGCQPGLNVLKKGRPISKVEQEGDLDIPSFREQIKGIKQPKFHAGDIIVCHSHTLGSLFGKKALVVGVDEETRIYQLHMTDGNAPYTITFDMEENFDLLEARFRDYDFLKQSRIIFRFLDLLDEAVNYLRENKEIAVKTEDNGISGWITDEFIEKYKQYLFDKAKNVKL